MSREKNVVADFLSCRPFKSAVSLVIDTMLDNIKPFHRDLVFFSIPFEILSKESTTQEEIE